MKAIVTVIGKDQVGIVAKVIQTLMELNINILDVSQTILDGYFAMMLICEVGTANQPFDEVKLRLRATGEESGVKVTIQKQEIFDAMHKL